MADRGTVLGLVGSPNREGRTNELVGAALKGAAEAGAPVELVQMADHVPAACKDCLHSDCGTTHRCQYDDEAFEYLSDKMLSCGALVLGTPIYWWDATGMVQYLILKMFRTNASAGSLAGLPALGIGIAGGTGNGLVSGLRPVYHFFQMMQMRALEPLPVTRFNYREAIVRAGELGAKLAEMAGERQPFVSPEERLLWYDHLPYLGLSRFEERRLLADLTAAAIPDHGGSAVAGNLAEADALLAQGKKLEALTQITRAYQAGVKAFEGK